MREERKSPRLLSSEKGRGVSGCMLRRTRCSDCRGPKVCRRDLENDRGLKIGRGWGQRAKESVGGGGERAARKQKWRSLTGEASAYFGECPWGLVLNSNGHVSSFPGRAR